MNISWSSTNADVLAHIAKHASGVEHPPFVGGWTTVELQPDMFSPQKYAVGVVVAPVSGRLAFRLISDTAKLQCIYGRKMAGHLEDILRSAEFTLSRAASSSLSLSDVAFDTTNLQLSPVWPTSGLAQEAVLSRLFNEVIALEPVEEDKPEADFVSLDNEQVRALVASELKRIAGLAYDNIVVDSKQTLVTDDVSGSHQLDFNLRVANGVGSVVSAVYKTPGTVELNLLRADRDLRTYGGIKKLTNMAVFLMTPSADLLTRSEYSRLSDLIDETSWRLERGGVKVSAFDEPAPIAQGILEWAGVEPIVGR